MAESQDWRERLAEARSRAVFEPTPTGATPYVATVERLAEALDAAEVVRAASGPSSSAAVLANAVAMLLREAINHRAYEELLRTRTHTQPDRVDDLLDRVNALLETREGRA